MLLISLSQYEPVSGRVLLRTQSDEQVSIDGELWYLPCRNFWPLKFAKQLIAPPRPSPNDTLYIFSLVLEFPDKECIKHCYLCKGSIATVQSRSRQSSARDIL